MSSGILALFALYSVNISSLIPTPGVSKTTPRCVGFWLFNTSSKLLVNPKIAEVFMPFELNLGFLAKAK